MKYYKNKIKMEEKIKFNFFKKKFFAAFPNS